MNINLYPYNMYLLIAAAIAALFFIFLPLKSSLRAIKAMMKLELDETEKQAQAFETKYNQASSIVKKAEAGAKAIAASCFLIYMLGRYYRKSPKKGIGGMINAGTDVIEDSLRAYYHISNYRKKH